MPAAIRCPSCTTLLQVAASSVGQNVRCPKCQKVLQVKAPTRPASRPAAAPPQPGRSSSGRPGKLPWILGAGVGVAVLLGMTVLWAAGPWRAKRATSPATEASLTQATGLAPTTRSEEEPAKAPQPGEELPAEQGKPLPGPKDEPVEKLDPPPPQDLPPSEEQTPQAEEAQPPPRPKDGPIGKLDTSSPQDRPADTPAEAPVPLFFAQLEPLADLLTDLQALLKPFGKDRELGLMMLMMMKEISFEGARGLDTAKPWGIYVRLSDRGDVPTVVAVLPVRNKAGFHRLLQDLGLREQEAVGDLTPVKLPQQVLPPLLMPVKIQLPEQVYLRIAGGHAHFCLSGDPNLLVGKRLLPAASLFQPGRGKLLRATLRLDQMPRGWQESLIARTRELQKQLQPAEPGSGGEAGDKLQRAGDEQVEMVVKETQSIVFEVGLGRTKERLDADLFFHPRKDSRLAAALAELGDSTSLFGDLVQQDVALGLLVNVGLPRHLRPLLPALVREATRNALRDATEKDRREAEPVFQTLGEVFAAGELDAGAVLRPGGPGKPASAVFGLKVPNGAKLDRFFREQVAGLDDRAIRDLFDLDAHTIEGVKVHRFRAQDYLGKSMRAVLGDNPYYYAFRSDAVFTTAGAAGKETLARALPLRSKTSPLALLKVSFWQMSQLLPADVMDRSEARRLFSKERPGRLRLELSAGKALHLHLEIDMSVVRLAAAHADALPIRFQTR